MCREHDRSESGHGTSEQSCLPDCCGPMIEKMMKTFAESSAGPEKSSPRGESQPDTEATCASMMRRMINTCGCPPPEVDVASDRGKPSCDC
jgi:hypothetical protein